MARDVVFAFWQETIGSALEREMFMPGDRLLEVLMADSRVRRLLVCDPYRSGPTQAIKMLLGRRTPRLKRSETQVVSPKRVRRSDPTSSFRLRHAYKRYSSSIEIAATKMGLERPLVISTNPFFAAYGHFSWADNVIYYAWDDWAELPSLAKWHPVYEEAYRAISDNGHFVCAVSQAILARIKPTGNSLLIPNGILPEEWDDPREVPEWLEKLPRPLLLYAGSIGMRLDIEVITDLAIFDPKLLYPFRRADR